MDYTEIIEQLKLRVENTPTNNKENRRVRGAYVDCLMLVGKAKQITEIEKLEFAIELLKKITAKPVCFPDRPLKCLLFDELLDLEHLRDKLINELKLK